MQLDLTNVTYKFAKCNYTNDVELLSVLLKLYSISTFKEKLSDKEEKVLLYYVKYGYTDRTKSTILLDIEKNNKGNQKITRKHLDQINFSLKQKGYLKNHPHNYRMKLVEDDIIEFYKTFTGKKDNSLFILGLHKK